MALRRTLLPQLIQRDGLQCFYCNVWLIPPGTPHTDQFYYLSNGLPRSCFGELQIDHIIPVSQNGGNHLANLELACSWCNSRRQDKPYFRFKMASHKRREIPPDVYEEMFSGVQGKTFDVD